jgi:hypothetical protein
MKNKIIITGVINKKGQHGFYNIGMFEDFAKKHPNKNTIITVTAEDKGRNSRLAYYHGKLIPEWQWFLYKERGEIKSIKEVDAFLKEGFPLLKYKGLSDLTDLELIMFMDYAEFRSLEEINVFIENAHVL